MFEYRLRGVFSGNGFLFCGIIFPEQISAAFGAIIHLIRYHQPDGIYSHALADSGQAAFEQYVRVDDYLRLDDRPGPSFR